MDLLKQFYDQRIMREEVFNYLRTSLDELAVRMVRNGDDTTNMKEAYKAIDHAESQLRLKYEEKKEVRPNNRAV